MKYIVNIKLALILGTSVCMECYPIQSYDAQKRYTEFQLEDVRESLRDKLCVVNDILNGIEEKYENKFEGMQAKHLKSIIAPHVNNPSASVEEMENVFYSLEQIVLSPKFLLDSPTDFAEDIISIKDTINSVFNDINTLRIGKWNIKREKKEIFSNDEISEELYKQEVECIQKGRELLETVLEEHSEEEKEIFSNDEISEELYEEGVECIREARELLETVLEEHSEEVDRCTISSFQKEIDKCDLTVSDLKKILCYITYVIEHFNLNDSIIMNAVKLSEQIQTYINKISQKP